MVHKLDLSTRIMLAREMLRPIPERQWGRATELAQTYDVSRTFLYDLRDRALDVLIEGLAPRKPGPQPQQESLMVDAAFIQRVITVMPMLKGTIRDIQQGLRLLFGIQRSVGYISQTLTAAGKQATAYNLSVTVPLPILGEADEIFQGRKPCLTLVDGRSFLVVNLTPAESRDGTTWGVTYLDLVERGIQFHDLACDGGKGLRAGVKEAQLAIPLRPDLFHILQDAHRLTRRLEGAAYKAMETAERARRADLEARGIIRRRGPRLKIKVPLPQAEIEETKAIEVFDNWCWLLGEVRLALEPLTPTHGIVSVAETKATIETAIELLKELAHPGITAFAEDLQEKMPELLAPLEWLEQHLTPVLDGLDADAEASILWTWQHRHELNVDIDTDIPERLRSVMRAVWDTLGLFHRSSSLAESVGCKASAHSWLRPYLQIHRGMPQWLLPLLQLFWNHHTFERGKRAGSSPLELAGVEDAPSLAEVLDQLFCPSVAAQAA
jgi:hypothetical protein